MTDRRGRERVSRHFLGEVVAAIEPGPGTFLLCLDPAASENQATSSPVVLGDLRRLLTGHSAQYGGFTLEATVHDQPGSRGFRLDWPILGVGVDHEAGNWCFIAGPGWEQGGGR